MSGHSLQPIEIWKVSANVIGITLPNEITTSISYKNWKISKTNTSIDREFVLAWLNLGVLLYKEKRYIEAEVAYQKALKYDPDHLLVLYNLGTLYDITNRNDLAIRYYKQVLNLALADWFLREMTNKNLKKKRGKRELS